MGSKTISLDEEAYKRLRREKNANESFSDVVKRLTRPLKHKSLADFAGVWHLSSHEQQTIRTVLKELGEQFDALFG
ncbi:MAG: antitoxin VapB family protein [Candidatus Heimdallarchaeota archaeon]|nr:MAG: antitoxin VapB family protein [Candidatus Heimdallarchaeota archaeon]